MTPEEFYGTRYGAMKAAEKLLLNLLECYPREVPGEAEFQPVVYCRSRLKSPESMLDKLVRKGLPRNSDTALSQLFDAIGVRAVCSFTDDVYRMKDWLCARREYNIIRVKDYIAYPKPNGYRSIHLQLVLNVPECRGLHAEIQLRTIAQDSWATLEHQIKYKQDVPHEALIRSELKRCADEVASVDLSMQTIRDLLSDAGGAADRTGTG